MSMFEAVIFDFGGVFTSSPVEQFTAYETANKLPKNFLGNVIKQNHHTNAWAKFERAEISREQFNQDFAAEALEQGHEITGNTLLSLLTLTMKPEMITAHQRIKARGLKTGCITNNLPSMDSSDMLNSQQDGKLARDTLASFDYLIESSKAGLRKPEPRIYQMMCEMLDVEPNACVFLDDLGINLKPAKALGMTTIKVPLYDVKPAISELYKLLNIAG